MNEFAPRSTRQELLIGLIVPKLRACHPFPVRTIPRTSRLAAQAPQFAG
jgi:hypothetical protein